MEEMPKMRMTGSLDTTSVGLLLTKLTLNSNIPKVKTTDSKHMLHSLYTKASTLTIAKKRPRSLLERIRDVNGPQKEEKTFDQDNDDFRRRIKMTISQ